MSVRRLIDQFQTFLSKCIEFLLMFCIQEVFKVSTRLSRDRFTDAFGNLYENEDKRLHTQFGNVAKISDVG